MEKIANSLMRLTKSALWVLGRGGGCAKWYKGPFASGPWALQRENDASKANLEN